jgi:hypothetical protein
MAIWTIGSVIAGITGSELSPLLVDLLPLQVIFLYNNRLAENGLAAVRLLN